MKHAEMILAHFNPKELAILDDMQGGRTNVHPKHETRIYEHLEELMHDPKIQKEMFKHYEHHAKGGRIGEILHEADKMRKRGRSGDTEMAIIGPKTHETLNYFMQGGSVNPNTGKPEYYGLNHMLGGIGHAFSKGVRQVGGAAMKALPGAVMGGLTGGPMGALAGGAASYMGSGKKPNMGQMANQAMNMGSNYMQSPQGQQMMGSMGQKINGANRMAQGFMNSPYGQTAMNAAKGMGNRFMNGKRSSPKQQMQPQQQQQQQQQPQMNQNYQAPDSSSQGYQDSAGPAPQQSDFLRSMREGKPPSYANMRSPGMPQRPSGSSMAQPMQQQSNMGGYDQSDDSEGDNSNYNQLQSYYGF